MYRMRDWPSVFIYKLRDFLGKTFFIFGCLCIVAIFAEPSEWLKAIGAALLCWLVMIVVAPR